MNGKTTRAEQLHEAPVALSSDAFFEHSLDLVCIAGTDGFFKRVNPSFLRTLGYTLEQLLSSSFMQLVHPDDRAATASVVAQLTRGEPCIRLENRYLCADGTYKWLQWTAAPEPGTSLLYAVAREITSSKLAEAQLRERDEQLVEAQAIAALGSWTRDVRDGVVTWSEQMYRLLGYEPFSFQPTPALYLRHVCEEDRPRIAAMAMQPSVSPYSHEYKIERRDGEVRTVQARGRTILDESGAPLRRVGTLQDITDRVRAEQEGRLLARVTHAMHGGQNLGQATLAALAELCDVAAWDFGELWLPRPDGSALESFASHAHKTTDGLKLFRERSEAVVCAPCVGLPGRVWATREPEWNADLSSASDDVFCRADLARSTGLRACVGLPLFIENTIAGVLVLLRERATPQDRWQLRLLGTVAEQLGVLLRRKQAEDALHKSEARFQAAALATNDVIYDWEIASSTLELSDAMRRMYGYPAQRVPIDWWSELLHPQDAALVWSSLSAALEDPNAQTWSYEYRFRRADGQYSHVMDRGYFFRDSLGKVTRMVGTMLDQTERVLAGEALRHAKEAAEEAGRAKSEFLANMSHEIRTPLTAVLGFADLLLDPGLSQSDRLNYAMTIRRNGEHLLSILNDILDISKIEAGKVVLEKILCSPAQLLTDVASLMRVRAVEKGLSFDVEYTGAIPAQVRTDPTRLRQIVLNLVSNAIKFTEQGCVRIVAACHDTGPSERRLEISVRDTGIGISAEQRKGLFQPFAQADPSMTRKFGGSGLGLGICAPLAAALGGRIDVESEPGAGSTFTLRIPVEIPQGTEFVLNPLEALSAAVERQPTLASDESQHSGRVLLAEDGRDNQVLISRLLSNKGFDVTIVANGRLAVEQAMRAQADEKPFDVVLMDMQMPELDGYGATAALRSHGYRGAIVALTAHALAGERERCIAAGCNDYLSKPVQRTLLVETVETHARAAREKHAGRAPVAKLSIGPAAPEPPLISEYVDDPDIADIVAQFATGLPAQILALSEAIVAKDNSQVTRLAHQLKGAAGGYGFPSISAAAAELEHASRAAADGDAITRSFQALQRLCRRVVPSEIAATTTEARPRLLVIDDSASIHDLVEARLRSEHLLVERAGDAAQGLVAARERTPDIILLDLHLPDMDGIEVCRRLKADVQTSSIPIIFLTGAADAHTKATALDLGATDYVTKPFDAVELRARVRSALRTKHYQELLAGRAQLDALTGLWNRAHFDTRLREEEARALRHGHPFSLMMLDVDHFKQINDNYGHPFGDRVLQGIANVLRTTARTNDVVCRYGGEEFAIILPDTAAQSGVAAAERMLRAVRQLSFPTHASELRVTVSAGLAAASGRKSQRDAFAATLLAAADDALYAAKRAGRNRVVSTSCAA